MRSSSPLKNSQLVCCLRSFFWKIENSHSVDEDGVVVVFEYVEDGVVVVSEEVQFSPEE